VTEARDRQPESNRDLDRIVFFSDAVFAIAITLLVLEIQVPYIPEEQVPEQLAASLLALWPKYLGYVISFLSISIFWSVHHRIFRAIRGYNGPLILLNFLFLMFVAFLPFPTALLGEYGNHQLPVAIYATTLAVGRLLLTAIYWYATSGNRLVSGTTSPAEVRFFLARGLTIPLILLLSIVVSFFSVGAAIGSWVLLMAVDAVVLHRRRPR
jgi:uncharacterized membrane protein